jgi:hypothetical protein
LRRKPPPNEAVMTHISACQKSPQIPLDRNPRVSALASFIRPRQRDCADFANCGVYLVSSPPKLGKSLC